MAQAQMVDPAIDREDEPFCYFSQPTDMIGTMDAREGTLVTPEGYFFAGYGELVSFTGNHPAVIHQRVKTLLKGHLPVIECAWMQDGLRYTVRRAPTEFGMVNAVMTCRDGDASVAIDADVHESPEAVALHLPWLMDVAEVRADGEVVCVEEGWAVLPAATRGVLVRWIRREGAPQLSFGRTMWKYNAEYRRRHERFQRDGRMN